MIGLLIFSRYLVIAAFAALAVVLFLAARRERD